MANVPVGPNRVGHNVPQAEEAPSEPWRDSVAASSRSAGNSFHTGAAAERRGRDEKKKLPVKLIAIAVGVLVLLIAVFWWIGQSSNVAGQIDKGKYQAVFFTNGQVYFGKLSKVDSEYYKLTDVFYIQQSQESQNPQETESEPNSNPQLIKLGNEIHGPEDAMIINKDQVLFFENLKADGKVSDVILKDRAQKQ